MSTFDDWDVTVRGDGPGLLLAHGAAGSIVGNFGPVIDDLAADHRVVGPCYPGVGGTPLPGRLELDDLADGVAAAARRAGLTSAVVLGISLGSAVAVRAAVRHPDLVAGLVLTVGFAVADPVLRQAADLVALLSRDGDPAALRARARLLTTSCLTDAVLTGIDDAALDEAVDLTERFAPPGTAAHFDLVTRVDVRADLAGIGVPTLAVVATDDRLVLPASHRRLAAGIAGAEVVEVPGAGHVFTTPEQWSSWLGAVRDFLDRRCAH